MIPEKYVESKGVEFLTGRDWKDSISEEKGEGGTLGKQGTNANQRRKGASREQATGGTLSAEHCSHRGAEAGAVHVREDRELGVTSEDP